jgi:hypothetical protein
MITRGCFSHVNPSSIVADGVEKILMRPAPKGARKLNRRLVFLARKVKQGTTMKVSGGLMNASYRNAAFSGKIPHNQTLPV